MTPISLERCANSCIPSADGPDRPRRTGRRGGTAGWGTCRSARPASPACRGKRRRPLVQSGSVRADPCRQPLRRMPAAVSRPSCVPTATRRSPGCRTTSGPGEGTTSPSRMIATIETPLRVRMASLAHRLVVERGAGGDGELPGDDPGDLAVGFRKLHGQALAAQQVTQRGGLVGRQRDGRLAGVRIIPRGDDQFGLALAVFHDADPPPGGGHEDPCAVPVQGGLFHPRSFLQPSAPRGFSGSVRQRERLRCASCPET